MSVIAGHFARQPELANVIKQLDAKIRTIIADNQKMQQYKFDPETMADLYFKISSQLVDSPDERISWLENLSNYHKVVRIALKPLSGCNSVLILLFLYSKSTSKKALKLK